MKKIYNLLLFTVLAAGLAACSSDEEKTDVAGPAAGNLQIITRTPQAAAGRGPVFRTGEFRILAFKNTGPDYVYIQDIPLGGMNFDGTALTGTVQLPAGDYKFLPSYGLVTPGNYTWPDFTDATLSDALYVTHTGENFPAAFMLNTPARCGSVLHHLARRPSADGERHAPPCRFARGRALHPRREGCRNGRLYRKSGR